MPDLFDARVSHTSQPRPDSINDLLNHCQYGCTTSITHTLIAPSPPTFALTFTPPVHVHPSNNHTTTKQIRRATVDDAMAQLAANPKRAAVFVRHAVANARNNAIYAGGAPDKLWVAEAFVTRGQYVKRTHFMSR